MIIAVDFDGTLVDHRYPEIGADVPHAVEWLKRWTEAGGKIILHTMRCDSEKEGLVLTHAVQWLEDRGIRPYGVNRNPTQSSWSASPKVYAHHYVDDAAIGCPLILYPGFSRRVVNWSLVGPHVEELIIEYFEERKADASR